MATIDPTMKLQDVAKLDGVKDLPMKVKARFAQALMAEAQGNAAEAEQKLNDAIAIEAEIANAAAA